MKEREKRWEDKVGGVVREAEQERRDDGKREGRKERAGGRRKGRREGREVSWISGAVLQRDTSAF